MPREKAVFTYDDYKALPEDGSRWEVLEGSLCREPAPRPFHQVVVANLLHLLGDFTRERGLGHVLSSPLDVVLSPENVVQPDIVFLSAERMHVMGEENLAGAPSLVVEVLSPTTRERDAFVKRRIYEHFGVLEYWLVDPEAGTVEVLALEEGRYRPGGIFRTGEEFSSSCFPGLTIRVEEIFHDPYVYH